MRSAGTPIKIHSFIENLLWKLLTNIHRAIFVLTRYYYRICCKIFLRIKCLTDCWVFTFLNLRRETRAKMIVNWIFLVKNETNFGWISGLVTFFSKINLVLLLNFNIKINYFKNSLVHTRSFLCYQITNDWRVAQRCFLLHSFLKS